MTLVIFGIGFAIFFITVFGMVMAGGVRLTKEQLTVEPELAPDVAATVDDRDSDDGPTTGDTVQADF